ICISQFAQRRFLRGGVLRLRLWRGNRRIASRPLGTLQCRCLVCRTQVLKKGFGGLLKKRCSIINVSCKEREYADILAAEHGGRADEIKRRGDRAKDKCSRGSSCDGRS